MQQYTARWATNEEIIRYNNSQAEIREKMAPLDRSGAGGLLAFWKAASAANFENGKF